jgi:IS5 family transposase
LREALKDDVLGCIKDKLEQTKASAREGRPLFPSRECLFRHRKVRYRGSAKNTSQLRSMFALAT